MTTYPGIGLTSYWTDGTTDGATANYAVYVGDGNVYKFDRSWQSYTPIFSTIGGGEAGISFDAAAGTLWTAEPGSGSSSTLRNYDLSGTALSSFPSSGPDNQFYLAYDRADDTLWTVTTSTGWFSQYSKAGSLLQQFQVPGFSEPNVRGAEFQIPAPGAAPALALSSLLGTRRRRPVR